MDYIFRSCLALVKKHKNLKQQLWDLEKALDALVKVPTTAFKEMYLAEKGEGSFAVRISTPKKQRMLLFQKMQVQYQGLVVVAMQLHWGAALVSQSQSQSQSKTKQKSLESGLASIGKILSRGTLSQIARSI